MVLEKKISTCSSHYKNMANNYATGRGKFEPQGHDCQLNEGDYLTEYKSSGPHGLREDVFLCFPIV